jgi:hypothetical protein
MDQNVEQLDLTAQEKLDILTTKLLIVGCDKTDCSKCGQFYFNGMDVPICKINPHRGLHFEPKKIQ